MRVGLVLNVIVVIARRCVGVAEERTVANAAGHRPAVGLRRLAMVSREEGSSLPQLQQPPLHHSASAIIYAWSPLLCEDDGEGEDEEEP